MADIGSIHGIPNAPNVITADKVLQSDDFGMIHIVDSTAGNITISLDKEPNGNQPPIEPFSVIGFIYKTAGGNTATVDINTLTVPESISLIENNTLYLQSSDHSETGGTAGEIYLRAMSNQPISGVPASGLPIGGNEGEVAWYNGTSWDKIQVVSVILRNTGSGWFAIETGGHKKIGVASVTNDTAEIVVNYDFTATEALTSIVAPDETFASQYAAGISVGLSSLNVKIHRITQVIFNQYLVTYNQAGDSWSASHNSPVGTTDTPAVSWNSGLSTIDIVHDYTLSGPPFGLCPLSSNAEGYSLVNHGYSLSGTVTRLHIVKNDGTGRVTDPNTEFNGNNFRFYMKRDVAILQPQPMNPDNVVSAIGNFWVFGIFTV